MDKESTVHTMFKASRHRGPHVCVTHRKPLRTAKATDPKDLLMVLAPSVGSSKGHYKEYEGFESYSEKGKHKMKRDNPRDNPRDN